NTAAQNLAINACLPVTEVLPLLLARANAEMRGLAAAIGSRNSQALDEELRNALGLSATSAA
ncbi:MAG: hypothetical protein QXP01_05660, partial [Candidatus Hadarchaeum sp.]